MPRRGRSRKKNRTHVHDNTRAQSALTTRKDEIRVPKSLVIRRGRTAAEVGELVHDLRLLMMPYTALNFIENPKNRKLTLSQYCTNLALPMGITHIMSFSQNQDRLNLMIARTPEGPTMSFRVHQFSLNRHIKALQKRPINSKAQSMMTHPPIVVTNNFGDHTVDPHIKLMRITFQNLFPQINIATVKLTECRRVVLFNLLTKEEEEEIEEEVTDDDNNREDEEDDDQEDKKTAGKKNIRVFKKKKLRQIVHIRQFAVKATPVGVNRRVRRLVQAKIPNLSKCQDIADYLTGNASVMSDAPSDSEGEDDPSNVVKLPDTYSGRGNIKSQTSALKLIEMGPRLSIELVKVQKGLNTGDVLYHSYIQKTPEEVRLLKERKQKESELKDQRRAIQEANVAKKRQALEEKKERKRMKLQQKAEQGMDLDTLRKEQQILDDDDDDDDDEIEMNDSNHQVDNENDSDGDDDNDDNGFNNNDDDSDN